MELLFNSEPMWRRISKGNVSKNLINEGVKMITPDWLQEKLTPLIKTKDADKVGMIYLRTVLQVSRFTNSQIHQHMCDEDQAIYFRVLTNGRMGVALTNSIDEGNLKDTLKKALRISHLKIDIKQKKDIPSFKPMQVIPDIYFEETVNASAGMRTKILQKIFTSADNLGVKFSGDLYNGYTQIAIISPQGVVNHHSYSLAGIKLIAVSGESSGYASKVSHDIHTLKPKYIADIAISKCLHGLKTMCLKPGHYEVILEPPAVAEIISWLNYIGFGAKSYLEETSFLSNKRGEKITAKVVNIYDCGLDKNTFVLPFDLEGLPRKKVYLIKDGTAYEPLTDSYYAKLLKMRSNGHASFPDDTGGPSGYNLVMQGGSMSKDKIIKSAKKSILVSRFHYINGFLDTRRALMTGMTRDGTFLIENGKIKCALKNMRFTESILEAFLRIKQISKERELIAEPLETLGSVYAPSLCIRDFNFTS